MIDVDLLNNGTRHPNLAQMKMSSYCKELRHDVHLVYKKEELSKLSEFDFLLVSKVFNYTPIPSELQSLIESSGRSLLELNDSVKLKLINPITAELNTLRTTLLNHLLNAASLNAKNSKKQKNYRLKQKNIST